MLDRLDDQDKNYNRAEAESDMHQAQEDFVKEQEEYEKIRPADADNIRLDDAFDMEKLDQMKEFNSDELKTDEELEAEMREFDEMEAESIAMMEAAMLIYFQFLFLFRKRCVFLIFISIIISQDFRTHAFLGSFKS